MTRSLKKGAFLDERLMRKIAGKKPDGKAVKTWARACDISPEMVGWTFAVHNGKSFIDVFVTEDMVGHKLGEFSPTRKFTRHGGKMQKEIDQKKKEAEIAAAKASSASADAKGPAKK
jgi:small subunit ribosomal protein S19